MSGAIEEIGARLVLMDRAAFISGMSDASASVKKFAESIAAAAKSSSASADKIVASQAKIADATKASAAVTKEATAANDAHTATVVTKGKAAEDEAKSTAKSTAATKEATTAVKKHQTALETLASNSVIKKTAAWGTAGLAAGAYEAIKSYTNFNKAVTQSAVDAGQKVKNLPQISSGILNISKETGVNAKDVADQFYRISSAANGLGKTNAQIMALTKNAAQLVVLGNVAPGSQTEQIGRIYGAMLTANLPGAKTPKQITQLVNSAVGHGDIRMGDMIGAMGKLLPAAKAVGASAPDTMAWIDMLTKQGMQGSTAGTLVNHSLQQLAHPTELGGNAETMVGIAPGSLQAMVRNKGLGPTISYLGNQLKHWNPETYYPSNTIGGGRNAPGEQSAEAQFQAWNITDPATMAKYFSGQTLTKNQQDGIVGGLLAKIFGNAKSATPALALMNDPAQFQKLINSIVAGATPAALKKSLDAAMNTPGRQMDIAAANVKATGIDIGKDLTPAATTFLRTLGQVASWFGAHQDVLKGTLGALGALVGAAVLVSGANKISKLASDLKKLATPIDSLLGRISGTASKAAGTTGLDGAALALKESAAALDTAAERLGVAGGVGRGGGGVGIPGKGGVVKTLENAGENDGLPALKGAGAYSILSKLKGGIFAGTAGIAGALRTAAYMNPEGIGMALGNLTNGWVNPKPLSNTGNKNMYQASANSPQSAMQQIAWYLKNDKTASQRSNDIGREYQAYKRDTSQMGAYGWSSKQNNQVTRMTKQALAFQGKAGSAAWTKYSAPAQHQIGPQISQGMSGQVSAAQKAAATALSQAGNKQLTAAQRFTDSASATKQSTSTMKQANSEAKSASSDQKAATALEKTAATQTGSAAKLSQSSAKTLQTSADAHNKAAANLSKSADALSSAAKALAAIHLSIDTSSIALAAAQGASNAVARK